ncbi:1058_t:CDS:2, partial [Racocetra persica]
YFEMVKNNIFSSEENGEWQEFLEILYSPRDQIYPLSNGEITEIIDITMIRDRPKIMENILNSYPQFFINAQQSMSQVQKRPGSTLGRNHLTDDIPFQNFDMPLELDEHELHEQLHEHLYEHQESTSYQDHNLGNNGNKIGNNNRNNNGNNNGNNHRNNNGSMEEKTLYDEFKKILICPRSEMSDDEWEMVIYECLDPWPQLVAQFEEIVAYEINEIRND